MTQPYTLYGAPFSLYTGKARAYLKYKNIPYQEVLSTLKVYKNVIVPNTGVRFIPVVRTPQDEYLQDTAVIIDELEPKFPENPVLPQSPKQRLVSQLFELYGDEWLLLPAMHYRWNKDNDDYIYACFGSVVLPGWPKFIQRFLGKKVGAKFKGFVPMLGITERTIPAIEAWYEEDFLPKIDAHFAKHDYLLGGAASIGDFGLMGSLYAHLYIDPYPGQLMKAKAPNLVKWIERMHQPAPQNATLPADDSIPETLLPILERLFKEQWPVLAETVKALSDWAGQQADKSQELPRRLGKHEFRIGDAVGERSILSFSVWKLQRILATYQELDADQKAEVDEFLKSVGGYEAMQLTVPTPVKRRDNKLYLA